MKHRIFAIGDIHGCFYTFEKLFTLINPTKEDTIILLGDYIDRGPFIKKVIDIILELTHYGFNIIPLMGNHESMLIESKKNIKAFNLWMFNGGGETLRSFGVKSTNDIEIKYLDFFQSLKYYYAIQNYLFVHAGFNEGNPDVFSDKSAMLWSRKEEYCSEFFRDKIIIHGHTPIDKEKLNFSVQKNSNVLNIDTGCVYSTESMPRTLSAIELPSMKVLSVNNIDISKLPLSL